MKFTYFVLLNSLKKIVGNKRVIRRIIIIKTVATPWSHNRAKNAHCRPVLLEVKRYVRSIEWQVQLDKN